MCHSIGFRLLLLALFSSLAMTSCADDGADNPDKKRQQAGVAYNNLQGPDDIIDPDDEYIVILGDVQEYTSYYNLMPYLQRTFNWALGQRKAYGNIPCVLQVGDVTNNNNKDEWIRYEQTIRNVVGSGLSVFSCTGNHDYDWGRNSKINNRRSTRINDHLAYTFPDSLVRSRFEEGRVENIIVHLPMKSADIDLIVLEFSPRTDAVEWAARWVSSNPDRTYILMTHEMLWRDGAIIGPGPMSYGELQFSGTATTYTDPVDIVGRLLKPNPNIIATICGHNGFAVVNDSEVNVEGRKIPIILFNLQYQDNGGDSMALLLRFCRSAGEAECIVYHTDNRALVWTSITGYRFPTSR